MPIEPTKIAEEMQRKAKVCETIAQDKTEESLTGASDEKAINEQDAKNWRLKSQVWQEAEAVLQAAAAAPAPPTKPA